jgi:hypothetical protein
MKTVSVTVPEADYEVFHRAARAQHRPVSQLIQEAMALYREERLQTRPPLTDLPVLHGHRPLGDLPTRADIRDEIYADETGEPQ